VPRRRTGPKLGTWFSVSRRPPLLVGTLAFIAFASSPRNDDIAPPSICRATFGLLRQESRSPISEDEGPGSADMPPC
jgi:hypothetical protein